MSVLVASNLGGIGVLKKLGPGSETLKRIQGKLERLQVLPLPSNQRSQQVSKHICELQDGCCLTPALQISHESNLARNVQGREF